MHILVESLPGYDQKSLFDSMLRDLARKFLQTGANIMREKDFLERNATPVGGVAAMISGLVQNNSLLQNHIIHWLTATNGEYGGLGLDARRAVIATLASRQGKRVVGIWPGSPTDLSQKNCSRFSRSAWAILGTNYRSNMIQSYSRRVSESWETIHPSFSLFRSSQNLCLRVLPTCSNRPNDSTCRRPSKPPQS